MALKYWKFPESIVGCQRVRRHEEQVELAGISRICSIAHDLSALICQPDADFRSIFHAAVMHLGVAQDIINEAVITTLREVNEIADTLRLEVESEKDTFLLLEKARDTLGRLSEQILHNMETEELPSLEALRSREGHEETVAYTLEAVAHEIRNPLTAVGGFARRLARTMDPSSDNWRYVEAILQEAKKLEQSLNEIGRNLTKGEPQEKTKEY